MIGYTVSALQIFSNRCTAFLLAQPLMRELPVGSELLGSRFSREGFAMSFMSIAKPSRSQFALALAPLSRAG